MAVVGGVLVLAMTVACLRHYSHQVANGKLGLGPEAGAETHFDYQVKQSDSAFSNICNAFVIVYVFVIVYISYVYCAYSIFSI